MNYDNIPLENVVFRLLYEYTLVYRQHGNRIPPSTEKTNFTHDETRGCLFDMNGIKTDIIYSCHKPIICPNCVERIKHDKVSNEAIETAQKEIKKIRKALYYRITDFIRRHPLLSLLISAIIAIVS